MADHEALVSLATDLGNLPTGAVTVSTLRTAVRSAGVKAKGLLVPVVTPPPVGVWHVTAASGAAGAVAGQPEELTATLVNSGTTPIVAPGVGFYDAANGVQYGWASDNAATVLPGASITLSTKTSPQQSAYVPPLSARSSAILARPGAGGVDALTGGLSFVVSIAAPPVVDPPPVVTPPTPGSNPFTAGSSWNAKIPAGARYTRRPELAGTWWFNGTDYGLPVVRSKSTDPVCVISVPQSWGWGAGTISVKIPAGVTGATGTDGTLVVVDGQWSYDFWQFSRSADGKSGSCAAWAKADVVNGDGWGSNGVGAGIHATGSSCLAGLVVGEELRTGITHRLAIALRFELASGAHVGQAISSDGRGPGSAIPEGALLAIPPSTPMPAGLSVPAQTLWKGCVEYGCHVIDVMGGNTVGGFTGDGLSINQADVTGLLGPSWTAFELSLIGSALQLVA